MNEPSAVGTMPISVSVSGTMRSARDKGFHSAAHSGIWLSWGGRRRFQPYGTDQDGAWQGFEVSRTAFDQLLLDYAHEQGVEVCQPCAVDRVQLAQENEIRVLTGAGPFSARIIVDATGRASWLSRRLGIARGARSPRLIARYGAMPQGIVPGLMKPRTGGGFQRLGLDRHGAAGTVPLDTYRGGWISASPELAAGQFARADAGWTIAGCRRHLAHGGAPRTSGLVHRRSACSTRCRRRACFER